MISYNIYYFVLKSLTNVNGWKLSHNINILWKHHFSWCLSYRWIVLKPFPSYTCRLSPILFSYYTEVNTIFTYTPFIAISSHFLSFGVLYTRSPGQEADFFCPRLLKHNGKLFPQRQHLFWFPLAECQYLSHDTLVNILTVMFKEKKLFSPISQVTWTDRS